METSTPFISEATYMCLLPIMILLICTITGVIRAARAGGVHSGNSSVILYFPRGAADGLSPAGKVIAALLAALYILMTSVTEIL